MYLTGFNTLHLQLLHIGMYDTSAIIGNIDEFHEFESKFESFSVNY